MRTAPYREAYDRTNSDAEGGGSAERRELGASEVCCGEFAAHLAALAQPQTNEESVVDAKWVLKKHAAQNEGEKEGRRQVG